MKKKNFGLLILIAGLLFYGINAYAAGNLIVDGQLQVTGEVRIYLLPLGCGETGGGVVLTTSATCNTRVCCFVDDYYRYYECSGEYFESSTSQQCNTVYVGKLFP